MWAESLTKKLLKAEKTNHSKQLQTALIVQCFDFGEAFLCIRFG